MIDVTSKTLNFNELWDASWQIFKDEFLVLFLLVGTSTVFGFLAGLLTGNTIVSMLLSLIVTSIITPAVFMIIAAHTQSKELSVMDALHKSLRLAPAFFATMVLLYLAVIGMYLLLIIPGIIFSVYWMFTLHAFAIDNKRWKHAFRESRLSTKGRWWKTVWYLFAFSLIMLIPLIILGLVTGSILTTSMAAATALYLVVMVILGAFGAAFSTVMYLNFSRNKIGTPMKTDDATVNEQPTGQVPESAPAQTPEVAHEPMTETTTEEPAVAEKTPESEQD